MDLQLQLAKLVSISTIWTRGVRLKVQFSWTERIALGQLRWIQGNWVNLIWVSRFFPQFDSGEVGASSVVFKVQVWTWIQFNETICIDLCSRLWKRFCWIHISDYHHYYSYSTWYSSDHLLFRRRQLNESPLFYNYAKQDLVEFLTNSFVSVSRASRHLITGGTNQMILYCKDTDI